MARLPRLPFAILTAATLAGLVVTQGAPVDLPFEAVQRDQLAVPNSFSNAWGDYDNDGDLDLGRVARHRRGAAVPATTAASSQRRRRAGDAAGRSHEFRGLSWGDYDGDGFIDLLGGSRRPTSSTVVLA